MIWGTLFIIFSIFYRKTAYSIGIDNYVITNNSIKIFQPQIFSYYFNVKVYSHSDYSYISKSVESVTLCKENDKSDWGIIMEDDVQRMHVKSS